MLKVETKSALKEKLQNFLEDIKIKLEDEKFSFDAITLVSEKIMVSFSDEESLENALKIKRIPIIKLRKENLIIEFSFKDDYIKEFYSSLMLQSLEIIRKRIDEVGTNEPIIQIQGNQRILVQLPGLKDPDRIKSLLGKTAKMNFRLVDEKNMQSLNEKNILLALKS